MLDSLAALSSIIRWRRSIKPVDMDPSRQVDGTLLMKLLENANWAPTHGMTEPWRFNIYQGSGRHDLSQAMQRIYRATTPAAEFREEKLTKMSQNPLLAPVVMVLWMARGGGEKIPELEEIEAVACAVQNLHLSAAAANMAGYWSTPPLVYTKEFAEWLEIRPEDRCLGLFYLGWPRTDIPIAHGKRQPIADKVKWHGQPINPVPQPPLPQ